MILAAAVACALRLPAGDVAALADPTPRAAIRLAADVAGCVPHAWRAALFLGLLAAGAPSGDPILDAQTSLGRGGRRR